MQFKRIFLTLVVSIYLYGCAENPVVSPSSLKYTTKNETIVLSEAISHKVTAGLANITTEFGLLPGKYTSLKEDAHGTFYFGEGLPIWIRSYAQQNMPYSTSKGGFWVPKNDGKSVLIFSVGGEDGAQYSTYENMIIGRSDEIQEPNMQGAKWLVDSATIRQQVSNSPIARQQVVGAVLGVAAAAAIVNSELEARKGKLILLNGSGSKEFDIKIMKLISKLNQRD